MDNEMRKILESAAKNSAITIKALELADKLNADMVEAVELGRPAQYREKVFQQRRVEMAKEIFDLVEAEAGKLQAGIEADRQKWQEAADRTVHARADRLRIAEARYGAMNASEIRAELDRVASSEFLPGDPLEVDALFVAARNTELDPVELEAFRETVVAKDYDEPWVQSPEARQREKVISLYANRGRDAFNVPIVFGDGKTSSLAFDEILDGSNPTDPQGEDND